MPLLPLLPTGLFSSMVLPVPPSAALILLTSLTSDIIAGSWSHFKIKSPYLHPISLRNAQTLFTENMPVVLLGTTVARVIFEYLSLAHKITS